MDSTIPPLCDPVAASRLPTLRLEAVLCLASTWAVAACLAYAAIALLIDGTDALLIEPDETDGSGLARLGGAARALLAAPAFGAALRLGQRRHWRPAALSMTAGAVALVLSTSVPQGALSPAWYLFAVVVLLVGLGLGSASGVAVGACGGAAFATCAALRWEALGAWVPATSWVAYSAPIAISFVLIGAVGALLHGALRSGLVLEGDHRRAIAQIDRSESEKEELLKHALRAATVGETAALVAHELKNSLQVILGAATLGARESGDRRDDRLRRIHHEIDHASGLVEQLLQRAHRDEDHPVETDLGAVCREVARNVRAFLPGEIELETRLPAHPVLAVLDPAGLEHALLNLVMNGWQAMNGCGVLTIAVEDSGTRAYVAVIDTGTGIPAADVPRVFHPFFTTKPRGKGTGLGLVAVDRFVRAAGGEVRVDSQVGRGSTFVMGFPAVACRASSRATG